VIHTWSKRQLARHRRALLSQSNSQPLATPRGWSRAGLCARHMQRLLDEALQAETKATEIQTAQLQRLIAWLDNRLCKTPVRNGFKSM
jgi:hypothetical protein